MSCEIGENLPDIGATISRHELYNAEIQMNA
jgi:hypothetical protein